MQLIYETLDFNWRFFSISQILEERMSLGDDDASDSARTRHSTSHSKP